MNLPAVLPVFIVGTLLVNRLGIAKMRRAKDIIACLRGNYRLYPIAIIGGLSGFAYQQLLLPVWKVICEPTVFLCTVLIDMLGGSTWYEMEANQDRQIGVMYVKDHIFLVNPTCSGLEGTSLMLLGLSCILIVDWPRFKNMQITCLYINAIAYMLLINVFRMLIVMLIYLWLGDASMVADIFHGNIGWIIYTGTIGLFVYVLYRITENEPGPETA